MSHFDITRAQRNAWSVLSRSHSAGRVASTYLFYGREGLGDWSLAAEFAALLNCHKPVESAGESGVRCPCGECHPCRSIRGLNFEGLRFIVPIRSHKNSDEAIDLTNEILEQKRQEPFGLLDDSSTTHIPISMAREIKRSLSIRAAAGVTRVVVFYQMEKMRSSAADALLKMIEEPPSDTVIILTAARPEVLPATIQSRAQKIRLERPPEPMVVDYLRARYSLSESRAKLLARISDRVLGQAIHLAEADDDSDESGRRAVGLLLFKSLFNEPAPAVVSRTLDLVNSSGRGEAERLMHLWQSLVRDCAYYATTGDETELVNVDFLTDIQQISARFEDSSVATGMLGHIKKTLADFPLNVHIQAALVALVLRLKSDIAKTTGNTVQDMTDG